MTTIDPAALALIKQFEGRPTHPEWPGGASGITIGYGSDIGADPDGLDDWHDHLDPYAFARLQEARGVRGPAAMALLPKLRDIEIPPAASEAVLIGAALPAYLVLTLHTFPGAEHLPAMSQGALVSLVYNRGASLDGPKRQEMAAIRDHIDAAVYDMVPLEFALMARLWKNGVPTASNLAGRRYYEGHLFERGLMGAHLTDQSTLLLGDSGDRVRAMQRALRVNADGEFGTGTLIALLIWQSRQGFSKHGMADADTLRSLGL